jgi:hypothetical protein
MLAQEQQTHIPEYLFAQIEKDVRNDLLGTIQIPQEGMADGKSALKD